jgi:hypothetical protein
MAHQGRNIPAEGFKGHKRPFFISPFREGGREVLGVYR